LIQDSLPTGAKRECSETDFLGEVFDDSTANHYKSDGSHHVDGMLLCKTLIFQTFKAEHHCSKGIKDFFS
jgi:hypothetical protein